MAALLSLASHWLLQATTKEELGLNFRNEDFQGMSKSPSKFKQQCQKIIARTRQNFIYLLKRFKVECTQK